MPVHYHSPFKLKPSVINAFLYTIQFYQIYEHKKPGSAQRRKNKLVKSELLKTLDCLRRFSTCGHKKWQYFRVIYVQEGANVHGPNCGESRCPFEAQPLAFKLLTHKIAEP